MVFQDRQRIVEKALKALPERHAEALQKRFFDGLSVNQTAESMAISRSRVSQLENFGIDRLQRPILQELTPSNMYSHAQLLRGKPSWNDLV
jgi:RNA polymerase sigma factor (sigma-70 family)